MRVGVVYVLAVVYWGALFGLDSTLTVAHQLVLAMSCGVMSGLILGRWMSLVHTAAGIGMPGAIFAIGTLLEPGALDSRLEGFVFWLIVMTIPFALCAAVGATIGTIMRKFVRGDWSGPDAIEDSHG